MTEILQNIVAWDQHWTLYLNSFHNSFWDNFMYIYTNKFVWIPLIIALLYTLFSKNWKVGIYTLVSIAILIFLCDWVTSSVVKPYVERFRPSRDPIIGNLVHIVNNYTGGKYGFCSSHASNSFGLALFTALLFRNKFYSFSIMLWATINVYTRIYLGVHYIMDIVCGTIYGLFVAACLYQLYIAIYQKYICCFAHVKGEERSEALFKKKGVPLMISIIYSSISILLILSFIL